MASVSLLHFLATGWFGPLRAGVTRAEIRAALGEPDAWLSDKAYSPLWRYGDFEFHFGEPPDQAWMIFSDQPGSGWPRPSPALAVDPWRLRMGMLIGEARAALQAQGLAFEEWTDTRPGVRVISLGSGVDLEFHRDDDRAPFRFGAIEQSVYDRRPAGSLGSPAGG